MQFEYDCSHACDDRNVRLVDFPIESKLFYLFFSQITLKNYLGVYFIAHWGNISFRLICGSISNITIELRESITAEEMYCVIVCGDEF